MFRPITWWDRLFVVAIIAKGLDGLIEVLGAVGLLLISPSQIQRFALGLIAPELAEDPHDIVANYLVHSIHGISAHAQLFATVYLLVHGAVKLALVVALLRDKMWAYPWMIGVLLAFIGYQLYRIILTPGAGLIALTIFDAIIVVLVLHEYRYHRRRARARAAEESERSPERTH